MCRPGIRVNRSRRLVWLPSRDSAFRLIGLVGAALPCVGRWNFVTYRRWTLRIHGLEGRLDAQTRFRCGIGLRRTPFPLLHERVEWHLMLWDTVNLTHA